MDFNYSTKDLHNISICLWGLYGIYLIICISQFIVKRYERETDLIDTVFFREHATFSRHLPNFFSSGIYATHLMMCLWGWRIFEKKKAFRDVKNPESIIGHFSQREIVLVKKSVFVGLIVILHAIGIDLF